MKPVTVGLLALLCLVGVSLAQYGFGGSRGGGTGYSWLVLLGALFVLMFIFNRSNFSGTTRLVYGNFTGTPILTSG